MMTFDQWWQENKEALKKTLGTGEPLYTLREVAHCAWVCGSISLAQTVNRAVEENLKEAVHDT